MARRLANSPSACPLMPSATAQTPHSGLPEAGIFVDLADQAGVGSGGRCPSNRAGFGARLHHGDSRAFHRRCQRAGVPIHHGPTLRLIAFCPALILIEALEAELSISMFWSCTVS